MCDTDKRLQDIDAKKCAELIKALDKYNPGKTTLDGESIQEAYNTRRRSRNRGL